MIGIFTPTEAQGPVDHVKALDAFDAGLTKLNVPHFVSHVSVYQPCDIAVVFGVHKRAVPASYARGRIIARHRGLGKPMIVVEKGFVRRDEYYHVGWNGLNGRADFCNEDMPDDRWRALGVKLELHRTSARVGIDVVVCGQVPWDASVQDLDHVEWCRSTVSELVETRPNNRVIFKPHPNMGEETFGIVDAPTVSDYHVTPDVFCVVTHNSNAGVEAVIAGIPTVACDLGSMAWPVVSHGITPLLQWYPTYEAREQWAANLAYAQWTLDEIAEGLPYVHLTRAQG